MNARLSELLSWLLEPLANSMMGKSSEVISDEHLKQKMDALNCKNKDWKPEEQLQEPISTRSEKEERRLWRMLEESDREQAKELERISKKAAKKVNQARTRIGAGKCQPGIADMFSAVKANGCKSSKTAESTISTNRPSNVVPRIIGQSNGSLSNVPVMGGCWGLDEHPPMTGTHEGEDETGSGDWVMRQDEVHSMEPGGLRWSQQPGGGMPRSTQPGGSR